jgi:hypothetical protein
MQAHSIKVRTGGTQGGHWAAKQAAVDAQRHPSRLSRVDQNLMTVSGRVGLPWQWCRTLECLPVTAVGEQRLMYTTAPQQPLSGSALMLLVH